MSCATLKYMENILTLCMLLRYIICEMYKTQYIDLHLPPSIGTVVGVSFIHSPRQRCPSSAVCSRVGRFRCVNSSVLSSQLFLCQPRRHLPSMVPFEIVLYWVMWPKQESFVSPLTTRALAVQQRVTCCISCSFGLCSV